MTPTTLMTTPTTRVTGTFAVLGWDERPYDDADELPALAHAVVSEELAGGLEGEASISYLLTYRDDGIASYVGLVRVSGRIGDRAGSFVMQEMGMFEGGVATGHWTILPGSSTGELRGIRGEGVYRAGPEHTSYSLDVTY